MRRYGWGISGLVHLLLAVLFMVITIKMPRDLSDYALIDLTTFPEAPAEPEIPTRPEAEEPPPEPVTDPTAAIEATLPEPEETVRSEVGVRGIPDWVTGPPDPAMPPISLPERTRAAVGPLRGAVTVSRADWSIYRPGATIVDTLLFAQQRLIELADSVMEDVRTGQWGTGADRFGSPIVEPGTIENLRGEPFLPLTGVAAAIIAQLADIAKEAWNRLIGRDPDALPEPDLDLTVVQVMAYAGLHDRFAVNIFEWHARLHPGFEGGLSQLQQVAAELAERGLCRLERQGDVFTYHRTIPLREVVQYYTSFLSRLPEGEQDLRVELIEKVAILVREPGY